MTRNKYKVSARGRSMLDLTGRTFGQLTALHPTDRRARNGSIYWHCKCTCGKEKDVAAYNLINGGTVSCGCYVDQIRKSIHKHLHFGDGTCPEYLKARKHRRDNTSGFRGVTLRSDGKYIAYIGFKGKHYYIGTYACYDDAVQARQAAESQIYGGYIRAYEAHMKLEPDKPLYFEVEKENGHFKIMTKGVTA